SESPLSQHRTISSGPLPAGTAAGTGPSSVHPPVRRAVRRLVPRPCGARALIPACPGLLPLLARWRRVSLVVNVASECGYTDSHYKALQQLQRDLGPYHFNVLAFPCNQFGQQEPDTNKEIESFARKTYGASFPMFSKITVSGAGAIPAFKYLIDSTGEEPTWNFWKYLVDPNGKVVKAWDSTISVEEIRPHVTELVRKIILKKKDEL
uniref:Glutathione peroxidase n=1 Tax=Ficedula albicollis TaxID=59894 RepID=A0A803VVI9_FICAL